MMLTVFRENIEISFFVSTLMHLSAQNCNVLTDAFLDSFKVTETRFCPKMYICPLPNLVSFVPTARSDWTGSYAKALIWELMPYRATCIAACQSKDICFWV